MKIKAKTGDLALGIFSILGGIIILILTKVQGLQLIKGGQRLSAGKTVKSNFLEQA